MKSLNLFIIGLLSCLGFTSQGKMIESQKIENLVNYCASNTYEAECLKDGLFSLIQGSPNENNSLVCKSSGSTFAVYNEANGTFLDDYYAKSATECRQTIRGSRNGLICSASSNSSYAVRDIKTKSFISPNYSISLNECLRSVANVRRNYICIAGPGGQFARYNLKNKTYLDSQYSLTLNDCISLL